MMPEDTALVQRVLAGEKTAFGLLVDRHGPGVRSFARRMLNDEADAEDVVQEAWLQAFLNLAFLRTPQRFGSWLLGIVANLCRMRLRTRKRSYIGDDWSGGRVLPDFTQTDLHPSSEAVYEARELHNVVLAAIATLSTEQQQAVRLHYLEGLPLWEISQQAGVPVGAVKGRLHRARARLRLALEHQFAQTPEHIAYPEKEKPMIEATIHDVIVRVPKGEEVRWLGDLEDWRKLAGMWVILVKEKAGERILPLWVGTPEGNAVAMLLSELSLPRPMTFDLMAQLVDVAGSTVEKVGVTRLHENTYFATLWLKVKDQVHKIDARPSDVLPLALRVNAPIFVAPEVFGDYSLSRGRTSKEIFVGLDTIIQKHAEKNSVPVQAEEDGREWRSFRSLPQGDLGGLLKPAEE